MINPLVVLALENLTVIESAMLGMQSEIEWLLERHSATHRAYLKADVYQDILLKYRSRINRLQRKFMVT